MADSTTRLQLLGFEGNDGDALHAIVGRHDILLGKLINEVGLGNVLYGIEDPTLSDDIVTHAAIAAAHQALVTLSGTPDYITLSGQDIIRALIDLASHVTGTLPAANIDAAIARDSELHAQDHKTRHHSGGGDAVQLDNLAAPDDNTDLNASTSKHGLLLKLGGGTTNFLRADGTWAAPAGGGGGVAAERLRWIDGVMGV